MTTDFAKHASSCSNSSASRTHRHACTFCSKFKRLSNSRLHSFHDCKRFRDGRSSRNGVISIWISWKTVSEISS